MTGVGLLALLKPEDFLAGTSDKITGRPTQLLHSIRCDLTAIAIVGNSG